MKYEKYLEKCNNIISAVEQQDGQLTNDHVLFQEQFSILNPNLTIISATTNELPACKATARAKYLCLTLLKVLDRLQVRTIYSLTTKIKYSHTPIQEMN